MTKEEFEKYKNNILNSCSKCDKTGWIGNQMCDCLKKVKLCYKYNELKIPSTFWDMTIDSAGFDPVVKSVLLKLIDTPVNEFPNLFISGPNMIIKNRFSFFIAKKFLLEEKIVSLMTISDIINDRDIPDLSILNLEISSYFVNLLTSGDKTNFIQRFVLNVMDRRNFIFVSDPYYYMSSFYNDFKYSFDLMEVTIK